MKDQTDTLKRLAEIYSAKSTNSETFGEALYFWWHVDFIGSYTYDEVSLYQDYNDSSEVGY